MTPLTLTLTLTQGTEAPPGRNNRVEGSTLTLPRTVTLPTPLLALAAALAFSTLRTFWWTRRTIAHNLHVHPNLRLSPEYHPYISLSPDPDTEPEP